MQVLLSMCLLPKHLMRKGTIRFLRDENIQERKTTIVFFFRREFYGDGLVIKMIEEMIKLIRTMRLDNTSVINEPFPKLRKETRRGQSLKLKILHKEIGDYRGQGGAHGNPTSLLIEFSFEAEKGRGQAKLNQLSCIRVSQLINYHHGLIDRNASIKRNHIETNQNFLGLKIDSLKILDKRS